MGGWGENKTGPGVCIICGSGFPKIKRGRERERESSEPQAKPRGVERLWPCQVGAVLRGALRCCARGGAPGGLQGAFPLLPARVAVCRSLCSPCGSAGLGRSGAERRWLRVGSFFRVGFLCPLERRAARGMGGGGAGGSRLWKPKLFLPYDPLRKYGVRSNQLPTLEVSFC